MQSMLSVIPETIWAQAFSVAVLMASSLLEPEAVRQASWPRNSTQTSQLTLSRPKEE